MLTNQIVLSRGRTNLALAALFLGTFVLGSAPRSPAASRSATPPPRLARSPV
jgi:hypothetical protein